jgi:hypothetical protein
MTGGRWGGGKAVDTAAVGRRRPLSSGRTFVTKVVLPTVWLAGFAVATVLLLKTPGLTDPDRSLLPPEMKWLFLGGIMLGAWFLYWHCVRLKRVEIDEQWLYVSNFLREIRIPLGDIEEVTENRWVSTRPITVEFRRETEFGSSIIFMPRPRWWKFWQAHPVVGELEAATRRVRGLPPEPH